MDGCIEGFNVLCAGLCDRQKTWIHEVLYSRAPMKRWTSNKKIFKKVKNHLARRESDWLLSDSETFKQQSCNALQDQGEVYVQYHHFYREICHKIETYACPSAFLDFFDLSNKISSAICSILFYFLFLKYTCTQKPAFSGWLRAVFLKLFFSQDSFPLFKIIEETPKRALVCMDDSVKN